MHTFFFIRLVLNMLLKLHNLDVEKGIEIFYGHYTLGHSFGRVSGNSIIFTKSYYLF